MYSLRVQVVHPFVTGFVRRTLLASPRYGLYAVALMDVNVHLRHTSTSRRFGAPQSSFTTQRDFVSTIDRTFGGLGVGGRYLLTDRIVGRVECSYRRNLRGYLSHFNLSVGVGATLAKAR